MYFYSVTNRKVLLLLCYIAVFLFSSSVFNDEITCSLIFIGEHNISSWEESVYVISPTVLY
jgi:hypothetical protein